MWNPNPEPDFRQVTIQQLMHKRHVNGVFKEFEYGSVVEPVDGKENLIFLCVDPGHANIISAACTHTPPPRPPPPAFPPGPRPTGLHHPLSARAQRRR